MRVVVLHDTISENAREDEVDSLVQAHAVSQALAELGHSPVSLAFSLNLGLISDRLSEIQPDLVFNLVESVEGLGRLIYMAPALLDHLQLPYTGSSTEPMFLTSNKLVAKKLLSASGIPTPPWTHQEDTADAARIDGGRFIIKSVWEHASIGLSKDSVIHIGDRSGLRSEMDRKREQLGGDCFAEAYIEGREFNLSLLACEDGSEVLPPAEIHFASYPPEAVRIVDYDAKWNTGSFAYHHTPRSFDFPEEDKTLLRRLIAIAKDCWGLFGLQGYGRVDFRVDSQGRPWVLEVNANPCLSPDGGFVAAANRAGCSFTRILERIIDDPVWPTGGTGCKRAHANHGKNKFAVRIGRNKEHRGYIRP